MIICIIAITFSFGIAFSFTMISNAKNIDILTKNTIFDIINNVEDVIITCISVDGEKNLDTENKLDATLLYIIKHKDDFCVVDNNSSNLDLNAEMITIGKINHKEFENELKNIFDKFRHNILDYKYYDGGDVNLVYEPCDYFTYDSKKLLYFRKKDNYYEIVYRYTRFLNNVENNINVKYILTDKMKIKDVIILSSDIR